MPRPLSAIARDIEQNWHTVSAPAAPYLDAMRQLSSIDERYGQDSASSIVRYFLVNAANWRGEHARRIKAELNQLLKK